MFEVDFIPSEKPLFNIRLCTNERLNTDKVSSCAGRGSRELADKLEKILLERSIPAKLIRSPCMNKCQIGPNLKIQGAELYNEVSGDTLETLVDAIKVEVERRRALAEDESTETSSA